MRVLDLFAGPGGWSEGMASIGIRAVGLELDVDACRTRAAAGHRAVRTDVSAYPPDPFAGFDGLVASPPCQAFSAAGKREGIGDLAQIHDCIERVRDGWPRELTGHWLRLLRWNDERSPLILEPLRWAWTVRPTWIACEQVPPCLPAWQHMADVLRGWGYDAVALRLLAADYGVPQTRLRAFLLAHKDGVRVAEPTHDAHPEPGLFGERKPWVSMAAALGWAEGSRAMDPRQSERAGALVVPDSHPSRTLCGEKLGKSTEVWRVATGKNTDDGTRPYERAVDAPSPVVDSRADLWKLRANNTGRATEAGADQPAPTLAGDQIRKSTFARGEPTPVRLRAGITLAEASILQGFRPDYPFQGTKTSRFSQVGNAVPPTWAAQIIRALSAERSA